MKRIALILVFLATASIAYAAPTVIYQRTLLPETDNTYNLGSSGLYWASGYLKQLCLSGDCKTAWPTGGSGGTGAATSSFAATFPVKITTSSSAITYSWFGLATTAQPSSSNLLVSNGAAGVYGAATTSIGCGTYVTCTAFSALGAASTIALNGTLSADQFVYTNHAGTGLLTAASSSLNLPNSALANSTIGATSPNSSLSFGAAAALGATFTGDLNLGHANSWTALQQFALASSTLFSVNSKLYVGGTATTTIDSAGNLSIGGTISGAGLSSCSGASSALTWNSGTSNFGCNTITGGTGSGLATTSPVAGGNLLEYSAAGAGSAFGIATSAPSIGTVITYTGTLGAFVGGVSGTFGIANSSITNAMLANNSISGVALGGTLAAHTHDATLTGTSYTGTAAVSDWGIDLTHANTWTGLQQFNGQASSTQFSAYQKAYFGGTATSSFSSAGVLTLATALSVGNGGTGAGTLTGCLTGNGTGAITGSGTCNTSNASVSSVGLSSSNSTLTIGSTPVTTSGTITADLNLGHSNAWTVLQTFTLASSTQLSNFGTAYFGGTATSSFSSTGVLTLASALSIASGGTNNTTFSMGNVWFDGTKLAATGSPFTVGNLISTTTATSTFKGPLTLSGTFAKIFGIFDGFGTELLRVNTASTTGSIFTVAATSSPSLDSPTKLFDVDQYGHLMASSTPAIPAVSSCGSGPAVTAGATDSVGSVTTGTGAPTACTITFGSAFATTPAIFVTDTGGTVTAVDVTSVSTTAFTMTFAAGLTSIKLEWFAIQGPANL